MTSAARKSLLIVAAPFGFGPASTAWLLTEALRANHKLTVNVQGSAVDFLCANLAADVALEPGKFSATFPDAAALAGFDAFVSVNHVPALRHLLALGLADRAIFFDNISHWRADVEGDAAPSGLLAHLLQDHPMLPDAPARTPPPGAITVAPIIWGNARKTRPAPAERSGIVIHTGGLTSASSDGDSIARAVSAMFGTVLARARDCGEPVTFLGNSALFEHVPESENARHLSSVSPAASAAAIAGAKLLVTTPGIGAIYEAMSCATPTILLPPTNSTQSFHYDVLTGLGLAGTIVPADQRFIRKKLGRVAWSLHGGLLRKTLAIDFPRLLTRLTEWLDICLDEARADERDALVDRAQRIFAALSKTPADEAIERAIATLPANQSLKV